MSRANDRSPILLEESGQYKSQTMLTSTNFSETKPSTLLLVRQATMQPFLSLELPAIPGFKRRRCAWVTKVRQGSYDQYRLLDMSDDALMVIMRRLLPRKEILRGRDLAAYRDVANLAFTCRRLLNLFRTVRTAPLEVYGLSEQLKIDTSPQGQIRYPPIADIQFFRNLIGESGTVLRRLSIPLLPSVNTTTLMQLLFSVCFHLEALHLADAGTLSPIASEMIAKSSIGNLRIYYPAAQTLKSLLLFERRWKPAWHCSISSHAIGSPFFLAIKNHEALACRRHKRKLVLQLKDPKSARRIIETLYPLLVSRLSLLRFIESVGTKHESCLIISTSGAVDLEHLLLERAKTSEDAVEPEDSELRALYIRSHNAIDLFLSSNIHRKEAIRSEVKGVYFVDVNISLADWNSCEKLYKCLLELFNEQNEVRNMQISREMVMFCHFPEVLHFLTRFKTLKRIHFSEPARTLNATQSSHSLTDKAFLEHLPTLLYLLGKNCKSLETVTMSSCFPTFQFEKRKELRPWINHVLESLSRFENNYTNVSVDGIRRVLLMWLERVNLER